MSGGVRPKCVSSTGECPIGLVGVEIFFGVAECHGRTTYVVRGTTYVEYRSVVGRRPSRLLWSSCDTDDAVARSSRIWLMAREIFVPSMNAKSDVAHHLYSNTCAISFSAISTYHVRRTTYDVPLPTPPPSSSSPQTRRSSIDTSTRREEALRRGSYRCMRRRGDVRRQG